MAVRAADDAAAQIDGVDIDVDVEGSSDDEPPPKAASASSGSEALTHVKRGEHRGY